MWSCGYAFQDIKYNDKLPDDFTNRVVYADSAAVRANLSDFVGHIIHINTADGRATKLLDRFVLANAKPPVSPVDPASGKLYYSKIDRSFKGSAKSSFLATISVDLSSQDMLEILIQDVATVSLPSDQVDQQRLAKVAASAPIPGTLRCFVQGARIAAINYKVFTQIDKDGKIAYGDSFQADGHVYSSRAGYSTDFKVSVDCIDLDVLRSSLGSLNLAEPDEQERLRAILARPGLLHPAAGALVHDLP